jgi:hypothetical protein
MSQKHTGTATAGVSPISLPCNTRSNSGMNNPACWDECFLDDVAAKVADKFGVGK